MTKVVKIHKFPFPVKMEKTRIRSLPIVSTLSSAWQRFNFVTELPFSANFSWISEIFKFSPKIHILFTVGFVGKLCVKMVNNSFIIFGKIPLFTALLMVIFTNFGKKSVFKSFGRLICQYPNV